MGPAHYTRVRIFAPVGLLCGRWMTFVIAPVSCCFLCSVRTSPSATHPTSAMQILDDNFGVVYEPFSEFHGVLNEMTVRGACLTN